MKYIKYGLSQILFYEFFTIFKVTVSGVLCKIYIAVQGTVILLEVWQSPHDPRS